MSSSRRKTDEMVVTKSKKQVLSCSTPEHILDSPSRDSDSIHESQDSPIPFLSTQEDPERATVVVWYDYGANSKYSPKNSTPLSTKEKKTHRLRFQETKQSKVPKRRISIHSHSQTKTQLPPKLFELNRYIKDEFPKKKAESQCRHLVEKPRSGSEDDIFNESDSSPKSIFKSKTCLRKNVLSSKCSMPESENGLDSDDSMNEYLIKISQATEDKILNNSQEKKSCLVHKAKQDFNEKDFEFSKDDIFENLNDSVLDMLTQMPVVNGPLVKGTNTSKIKDTNSKLDLLELHEACTSKHSLARHSSMPESPSMTDRDKSATTGISMGRYKSMPHNDRGEIDSGNSPIRCTPSEIQKKRQQAREKLHAKRLLPFTQTQKCKNPSVPHEMTEKGIFQPKVPSTRLVSLKESKTVTKSEQTTVKQNNMPMKMDLRSLIEKKRQEALDKLRRKQGQRLSNK